MEAVLKMKSPELLNLLASHGIGLPYQGPEDTREAGAWEYGGTAKSAFVKVVVRVNSDEMWDYGARLTFPLEQYLKIRDLDYLDDE